MFHTTFDAEKKQWNGENIKTEWEPETSLGIAALKSLEKYGSNVAQICADSGKTITFEELRVLTICIAKNLRNFGCKKGTKIFFSVENEGAIAPLVFAAFSLGCKIAALSPYPSKLECQRFLAVVKPKFVISTTQIYPMITECLLNLKINATFFTIDGQTENSIPMEILCQPSNIYDTFKPVELNGATEPAFIMSSSGTTGLPKCVCLSHATILDKGSKLGCVFKPTDVVLAFSDIGSVSHIRALFAATINGAARIVNAGHATPDRYFDIVERHKVTISILGAYFAKQIVNHPNIKVADLSSLRILSCGGNKIPYEFIRKINKNLPNGKVCVSYGMTETMSTVAWNLAHSRNNCVGQLIAGCGAKIVDENGQRLGVNEEGELCLKLPFPFLGYLNSNEPFEDSEGFLMTKDIARFDKNGDLFIVDRKNEIFKSDCEQVSPQEIEEFLNTIEGVKQSCIVPIPNEKYFNLAAAVIVKSDYSTCTEQSISDAVANKFIESKHLRGGVYFVNAIPMTVSGKIARKPTKKMAMQLYNNNSKLNDEELGGSACE